VDKNAGELHHFQQSTCRTFSSKCFADLDKPGQWTRVLTNLVGNALKYTKSGSVYVGLHAGDARPTDDARQLVPISLVIEDTGIGISQNYLDNHLYTPFMQENSHANGTGLGLSIVDQILRALGAEMDIQSTPGKGTKVVVKFSVEFSSKIPVEDQGSSMDTSSAAANFLKGKRFSILTEKHLGEKPTNNKHDMILRESVSRACVHWLGIESPFLTDDSEEPADLYWTTRGNSRERESNDHTDVVQEAVKARRLPLAVLASSVDQEPGGYSIQDGVIYLDQPYVLSVVDVPRRDRSTNYIAAGSDHVNWQEHLWGYYRLQT